MVTILSWLASTMAACNSYAVKRAGFLVAVSSCNVQASASSVLPSIPTYCMRKRPTMGDGLMNTLWLRIQAFTLCRLRRIPSLQANLSSRLSTPRANHSS